MTTTAITNQTASQQQTDAEAARRARSAHVFRTSPRSAQEAHLAWMGSAR